MRTICGALIAVGGCRDTSTDEPPRGSPADTGLATDTVPASTTGDTGTTPPTVPVECARFSGQWGAPQAAAATLSGADLLGMTVAFGDLDGDGREDLLVGAPGGAGAVYGWTGPLAGDVDVGSASVTLTGEPRSGAGTAVAFVGDWTGDGVGDLFVGAPRVDGGRGRLYFLPGPLVGEIDLASAVAIDGFEESGVPSGVGNLLQSIGDLTGDGLPDLLVGGDEVAYTWVLSGPPAADGGIRELAAAVLVPSAPVGAGESFAHGIGDLDGDGADDVMVGAWGSGDGGRAWLVRGPVSGTVELDARADLTIAGGPDSINVGVQVTGGHDVTGDGVGDLWVGDLYAADGRGEVYLFDGTRRGLVDPSAAVAVVRGAARDDLSGMVVDPGDLDGDGLADVVVGSVAASVEVDVSSGSSTSTSSWSVPGAAYVLYAPLSGVVDLGTADAVFAGGMPGGIAHRVDTDVDGDGCRDLWIGSPTSSEAYAILGPSSP